MTINKVSISYVDNYRLESVKEILQSAFKILFNVNFSIVDGINF